MAILVFPNYQSDPSRKQSEKNKGHEDSGIMSKLVHLCYVTLIFHRMALAYLGFYYPFFSPFPKD
jgi:hypothetical protein